MGLFDWIKGRHSGNHRERRQWHEAWSAAIAAEDPSQSARLKEQLASLPVAPGDDNEVELEMLDALDQLQSLWEHTNAGGLPVLETHHRVVAGDPCHFTAPATLPDDPAQASGRLLFTSTRSLFIGAGRPQPVAWHSVREVVRSNRDVVLVRADGSAAAHFRFNTFGDAAAAVFLARRLKGKPARA